ncbi:MAG: ATP-binding cassette domain-containing protein [Conexivisphaerales archaeon]
MSVDPYGADHGTETDIIKVRDLSKHFGKLRAVDGITFEVKEGEIFGFLGPNGAGKTTTINMLTTLLPPTSGEAIVCGFDVRSQPNEVRKRIGVVPQEYTADEDLTGMQNILLCGDLYGLNRSETEKRARELLDLVELTDAANRKVSAYSGGMRRRLELASGLINSPQLLFLDEPTLGLDVQTRTAVWEYIKQLKEEYSMTLFVTTHYLEEADSLCDRIAIIDHGKIVKIGSPSELKAGLGGDVIQLAVEGNVDLTDSIKRISLVKDVKKVDSTYRIKAERGEEAAPLIIDMIRSNGLHVTKISLTKPTLDEVYLEYTGRAFRDDEDPSRVWAQRMTMRRARA